MTGGPARVELAPGYSVPRVLVGLWQLSEGHSARGAAEDPVGWLGRFVDAGLDTFDCADIYTGVEATLGRLIASRPPGAVQVHTKLVPDRSALATIDRTYVRRIVERSLTRLGVERVDLVQFHWWDFGVPGWVEAAGWLDELRVEGKVRSVGVTNFDAARLQELCRAGVPVASDQVQYSLLDRRPARGLADVAGQLGVRLIAYGTVAGGLLGGRWLGRPRPEGWENRSLEKYALIADESGGWEALQDLLAVLARVARDHGVEPATAATAWALQRPGVAAAVVGARDAEHLAALVAAASLRLSEADRCRIEAALAALPGPPGDVYGLERDPRGRHAAIMRTELNRA